MTETPLILNGTGYKLSLYNENTEEFVNVFHKNIPTVMLIHEYDEYYIEKNNIPIYINYKTTISDLPIDYDQTKCMLCVEKHVARFIQTNNLWKGILLTTGKLKYKHEYDHDMGIYGFAYVNTG